jgi:hypothetical protein
MANRSEDSATALAATLDAAGVRSGIPVHISTGAGAAMPTANRQSGS